MPFYQNRGSIPSKRHIQFRDSKNNLYWEELISREGFSSQYSNVYHLNPPTNVSAIGDWIPFEWKALDEPHRNRHIRTHEITSSGDAISARVPLLFNHETIIHKAHVDQSMELLYRNGHYDELLFIQSGSGTFMSNFGALELKSGDYVVIPRGIIWQLMIDEPIHMLVTESSGPIETPNRYRNRFGQMMEDAPFCERDIQTPTWVEPKATTESVDILVRLNGGYQAYTYDHHPFDIVGWDGYYFPWIFNINDFMPITGKVHLPPPIHQTFQSPGFVVCSFVPRLYDYHDDAIPAPYAHSNVDSDEVLFYVKGNFMSRKGIEPESITIHPMGLPHGPQPGKIEASIGKKETVELAVMIDTFSPLQYADVISTIDDPEYPYSWQQS